MTIGENKVKAENELLVTSLLDTRDLLRDKLRYAVGIDDWDAVEVHASNLGRIRLALKDYRT